MSHSPLASVFLFSNPRQVTLRDPCLFLVHDWQNAEGKHHGSTIQKAEGIQLACIYATFISPVVSIGRKVMESYSFLSLPHISLLGGWYLCSLEAHSMDSLASRVVAQVLPSVMCNLVYRRGPMRLGNWINPSVHRNFLVILTARVTIWMAPEATLHSVNGSSLLSPIMLQTL